MKQLFKAYENVIDKTKHINLKKILSKIYLLKYLAQSAYTYSYVLSVFTSYAMDTM